MIPTQEIYMPDTPFEVHYLDGVAVTREIYEITGGVANGWTLVGSQRRRKHFFKRKAKLDPRRDYFMRYIIMIDLNVHVMISDNREFDGWEHYMYPIATNLLGSFK